MQQSLVANVVLLLSSSKTNPNFTFSSSTTLAHKTTFYLYLRRRLAVSHDGCEYEIQLESWLAWPPPELVGVVSVVISQPFTDKFFFQVGKQLGWYWNWTPAGSIYSFGKENCCIFSCIIILLLLRIRSAFPQHNSFFLLDSLCYLTPLAVAICSGRRKQVAIWSVRGEKVKASSARI